MIAKLLRGSRQFVGEKKNGSIARKNRQNEGAGEGGNRAGEGDGAVTSSWAIVLRNFMRARLAGTVGERNPYRIKASICTLLFHGGVRAQLTSLRESRLTCFATIIQPFRIHFSFPPQFTSPLPSRLA